MLVGCGCCRLYGLIVLFSFHFTLSYRLVVAFGMVFIRCGCLIVVVLVSLLLIVYVRFVNLFRLIAVAVVSCWYLRLFAFR